MSNPAIEQLASTLNVPATELTDLAALSEARIAQLNGLITTAQQKQRQTLSSAIENGLNYLPAILRGTVKKIIRG